MDGLFRNCRIKSAPARRFLGELLGTCLATVLIDCSIYQFALSDRSSRFGLSFAIGTSITFALFTRAMISPIGPVNPNATIGLALSGFIPAKLIPLYYLGELLGAFFGHLWSYGLYRDALINFGNTEYNGSAFLTPQTVFMCSLPRPHASLATQMFDIFSSVTVFIFFILVTIDKRNFNIPAPAQCILIGVDAMLMSLGLGHNTGGPLNMAIDVTGRIVSSFLGWGSKVWSYGNYYFWIPIVMAQLGGVMAALLYNFLIGPNLPENKEEEDLEMMKTNGYQGKKLSI